MASVVMLPRHDKSMSSRGGAFPPCHREGVARGDLRDCFTCLRQVRNDKEGCNHGGFAMTKRVSSQGGASPPCHREGSLFPCHREAVNTAVAISGIASSLRFLQ